MVAGHRVHLQLHFNPRSPCGERRRERQRGGQVSGHFNPRSPCGERPGSRHTTRIQHLFQSTLPVWGATSPQDLSRTQPQISIHAPRVGSDSSISGVLYRGSTISIHAPRVGSDRSDGAGQIPPDDFNPRSPCGERRLIRKWTSAFRTISIHAPRVGSDQGHYCPYQAVRISIHAPRVGSDDDSTTD